MSSASISYYLNSKWGDENILIAHYDFDDTGIFSNLSANGAGSDWTGEFLNDTGTIISSKTALAISATGSTSGDSVTSVSGMLGDGLDLGQTNLRLDASGIDLTNGAILIDFSFNSGVSDCILFGGFEKTSTGLSNGDSITISNGFNVGVTDRGHLFVHGRKSDGDFVSTFEEVELAERNVIGITSFNGEVSISLFDYFNDEFERKSFYISEDYISSPDEIFFGGSNEYFATNSGEDVTANVKLQSLSIFDSGVSEFDLFTFSKYMLGAIQTANSGSSSFVDITGQTETIVYDTGIIGWTGVLTQIYLEPTGRSSILDTYQIVSSGQKAEGDIIQEIQLFETGGMTGVYYSEYGYLFPNLEGTYEPTGDNAYSILGLQTGVSLDDHVTYLLINSGDSGDSPVYQIQRQPITGTLDTISGTIMSYQGQTLNIDSPDEISFALSEESEKFKKDYIYFLGCR